MHPQVIASRRVANQGGSCTTAAVLTAFTALGARRLPELGPATLALGAAAEFGPPGLLDYVALPGRRAPLDVRIEALAAACGLCVASRSRPVLPGGPRPPTGDSETVIAHVAYGQEAPGKRGTFGWNPLRPATYATGGHSVVLAGLDSGGRWLVVDSNLEGLQRWERRGWAMAETRIRLLQDR